MARSLDELSGPFFVFLTAQGKKATTAVTYVSQVRRVLGLTNTSEGAAPSQEDLDTAFAQIFASAPSTIHNCRSSWRWYARWLMSRGLVAPMPRSMDAEPGTVAPAPFSADLPQWVVEGVRALHKASPALTYKLIRTMTWEDFDFDTIRGAGEEATICARHPLDRKKSVRVPLTAIESLLKYAEPGADYTRPLVPASPGGDQFYSERVFNRLVAQGSESLMERVARHRREEAERAAGPPGSALGSDRHFPEGGPAQAIAVAATAAAEEYTSPWLQARAAKLAVPDLVLAGRPIRPDDPPDMSDPVEDEEDSSRPVTPADDVDVTDEDDALFRAAELLGIDPIELAKKLLDKET